LAGAAFQLNTDTGQPSGDPITWELQVLGGTPGPGLATDWYAGTGDLGLGGLDPFFAGAPQPSVDQFRSAQVAFSPQFGFPQVIVDAGLDVATSGDPGNRTVRYTGEIFIPEDGTYNFKDGVDQTTRLIIDGQTIIADSQWTEFDGNGGDNGGSPISPATFDVADGGEWLDFEFVMSESCCGNAAALYWDYDAANGGLGANTDFPSVFTDPAGLGALVPPENFRATTYELLASLTGTGEVGGVDFDEAFMDALGNTLSIPLGQPTRVRLLVDGRVAVDTMVTAGAGQVVPEPSTFALAALGLLGLVGWRRRRK